MALEPVTLPGTGTAVAADDCGADGVVQITRLAVSTDGSATAIPATATTGLRVHGGACSTATLSNVNDTASSTSLLASASTRLGVMVFNDSAYPLFLKYGATASATSFTVKIAAGAYWEMPQPIYTGAIDGIWSVDGSGAARITELT